MKSFTVLPMKEGLPPSIFSVLIAIIKYTTVTLPGTPSNATSQSLDRCPLFLERSGRALAKYCSDFLNVTSDSSTVESLLMRESEGPHKPRVVAAARVTSSLSSGASQGKLRLFARGSASYLFSKCTGYLRANGTTGLLDHARRTQLDAVILSADPINVQTSVLAYKDIPKEAEGSLKAEIDEPGYILVALISFSCPPRLTTYNILSRCRAMGVALHFCSESSRPLATMVARKLGLDLNGDNEIVDSEAIPSIELSAIPTISCVHSCDAQDASNFLRRMCSAKRILATLTMSELFTSSLRWSHIAGIQGLVPKGDGDIVRSAPQFAGLKGVRPPAITPLDVYYAVEAIEISKNILYNNRASTLPPITEVTERTDSITNSPVPTGPLSRHVSNSSYAVDRMESPSASIPRPSSR